MRELLGWYGYGSHKSTDIATSNSSNFSAMALPHDLTSTISNDIGTTVTMLMNKRHRTTQSTDNMNNGNSITENVDLTNAMQNKNTMCADKQGSYIFRMLLIFNSGKLFSNGMEVCNFLMDVAHWKRTSKVSLN